MGIAGFPHRYVAVPMIVAIGVLGRMWKVLKSFARFSIFKVGRDLEISFGKNRRVGNGDRRFMARDTLDPTCKDGSKKKSL
jgi:hypothetical protein